SVPLAGTALFPGATLRTVPGHKPAPTGPRAPCLGSPPVAPKGGRPRESFFPPRRGPPPSAEWPPRGGPPLPSPVARLGYGDFRGRTPGRTSGPFPAAPGGRVPYAALRPGAAR